MRRTWVRAVLGTLLVALLGLGGWAAMKLYDLRWQEAVSTLPAVDLMSLGGEPVAPGRFAGRKVALLFVSVDCDHCRREIAGLDRMREAQGARALRGELTAITLEGASQAREFQQRLGIGIPLLAQGRALARAVGVRSVPTLVLVDAEGSIVYRHEGRRSARFVALVLARFERGEGLSKQELWASYNNLTLREPAEAVEGGRNEL